MLIYGYRYKVSKRLSIIFGEWQGYDRDRTQKRFGELLGVTRGSVVRWLRGDSLPKLEQIYQICLMCNCSADWLLGLTTEREEKS